MSDERSASKCPRFGKMFRGCKFEARYDTMPPGSLDGGSMSGNDPDCISAFFHGLTRKIYVHDICVRCGYKVLR